MSRRKAKSFETLNQFFNAIDSIAATEVELRALTARRDAEIQKIQADYAPSIDLLEVQQNDLIVLAEKYADEHRDELFPKGKSATTQLANYGFRLGNPTLKLLNKKCSWEGVVAALKVLGLSKFVRKVEEADKDAIHAAKLQAETMAKLGLKIGQTETFYVEPKVDGAETIKTEAVS